MAPKEFSWKKSGSKIGVTYREKSTSLTDYWYF